MLTAVGTSARAVIANPVTMAIWGLIVAAGLAIGCVPFFIGLAVVMPVLGHSTWHLYSQGGGALRPADRLLSSRLHHITVGKHTGDPDQPHAWAPDSDVHTQRALILISDLLLTRSRPRASTTGTAEAASDAQPNRGLCTSSQAVTVNITRCLQSEILTIAASGTIHDDEMPQHFGPSDMVAQ